MIHYIASRVANDTNKLKQMETEGIALAIKEDIQSLKTVEIDLIVRGKKLVNILGLAVRIIYCSIRVWNTRMNEIRIASPRKIAVPIEEGRDARDRFRRSTS